MSNRVLIVDDEQNIVDFTRSRFEREGLTVRTAANGAQALAQLLPSANSDIDIVILDVGLPDIDGFEVLRRVRNSGSDVPVIILSARTDDVDRIVGLELGADDYVVKPFNPRELAARVRGLLRRMEQVHALREQVGAAKPMSSGLTLDPSRRLATYQGQTLDLRPKEFDLLSFLAAHPGQVFSRPALLERVWGYDRYVDERTVDVHVRRLREKLTAIDPEAALIETEWGVGYKFINLAHTNSRTYSAYMSRIGSANRYNLYINVCGFSEELLMRRQALRPQYLPLDIQPKSQVAEWGCLPRALLVDEAEWLHAYYGVHPRHFCPLLHNRAGRVRKRHNYVQPFR